ALHAIHQGRFSGHAEARFVAAINETVVLSKKIVQTTTVVGRGLFEDPKKNAPSVLALALGFVAGSGGTDGNGGVPDSDLLMGIGAHRSILTHSIVAGIAVEGAILAVADLAGIVCEKIP